MYPICALSLLHFHLFCSYSSKCSTINAHILCPQLPLCKCCSTLLVLQDLPNHIRSIAPCSSRQARSLPHCHLQDRKSSSKKLNVQGKVSSLKLSFVVLFEAVIWWHLRSSLISFQTKHGHLHLRFHGSNFVDLNGKNALSCLQEMARKSLALPNVVRTKGSHWVWRSSQSRNLLPERPRKTTWKVWRLRSNLSKKRCFFPKWYEQLVVVAFPNNKSTTLKTNKCKQKQQDQQPLNLLPASLHRGF